MPYYNHEAKELRKTKTEWRTERTEKSQVGFSTTNQKVGIGDCGRFVREYFKLRRNMDGNLELDCRSVTEADRVEIHIALTEEFGFVTRYTVEQILESARISSHLPYDPFPEHGLVKGIGYDLLYEANNIGLHKCSDGIHRIRTYTNGFLGTTEVTTGVMDAIAKYNEVSKLFGIQETIGYYHLNH